MPSKRANPKMSEIKITPAAAQRIREQLDQRGHGLGLRVGVKSSGCSGYAYVLDYADEKREQDTVIEAHGVSVLIDPDSLPLLDGLTLDFRREGLNALFKFDNPNAQELCGCGESFSVNGTV